jgi:hypothetical protein
MEDKLVYTLNTKGKRENVYISYNILAEIFDKKISLAIARRKWKDNIKMNII